MEKKMKRIPFDVELAKAITKGEKEGRVVTKNERLARIICWDYHTRYKYPIIALVKNGHMENVRTYNINGKNEILPDLDIFLEVPDEQEVKPKFELGQEVLVRNFVDSEVQAEWVHCYYSHFSKNTNLHIADGSEWKECIPYNGRTKHLLGTTDDWEG